MAFRLKLIPDQTSFDFFRWQKLTFGISAFFMVASVVVLFLNGLNFGIDFRGGTTIRTESAQPVDVAAYRDALSGLDLGDVAITEVFDPGFAADQNVSQVRISAQDGTEAVTPQTIATVEEALRGIDPEMTFPSVESVGPKVSGELVQTAIYAVLASLVAISIYIWLRFEWQFAVGAIVSLFHDVLITMGIFALFQIRFDLTTIAALLTIVGYSINDTVVVFDRLRENLVKYKTRALREVMNLSVNETLSRTTMTSVTTLLALIALLVLGGDVIRGFVFAITFGIFIGTYSSVYVAKNFVLWLGVRRDKPDPKDPKARKNLSPFEGAEEV
ncbi:protein translocase subunit SecF [Paracoccus liaowanqingii]|uniref:Protein-export membrane protein SecF n=1 Tax=Paracoccus liaowanqingii TaxID=2560053 RepID=A0A4P7HNH4_9RHOB|nr:protein translocase subunit SecF [Paracoccus liaowanqingii]QBX35253.1 protein translocase subunit SecF [Paracoccus liaowanqingii]